MSQYYLSFDGNNDYIQSTNVTDFLNNIKDSQFKITFATTQQSSGGLLSQRSGDGLFWVQTLNGNSVRIWYRDNNRNSYRISVQDASLFDGSTNELDVKFENNVAVVKINGQVVSYTTEIGSNIGTISSNDDLYIGVISENGPAANYFEGEIYEVKLYYNDNIYLHYDFSEGIGTTLNDSVGNNDGTIVGATWKQETAPPQIVKGGPKSYLSFDGVDDYVSTVSANDLFDDSIDFSFNLIIELLDLDNYSTEILVPVSSNNGFGLTFNIYLFNGELIFRLKDNGSNRNISFGQVNTNVIYDLEVIYTSSNNKIEIYLNDQLKDSTFITSLTFGTDIVNIGYNANPNSLPGYSYMNFYGFKVYNDSQLILNYDMSDGSGTTLTDVSGNGNDATIVGATWQSEANAIQNIYYGAPIGGPNNNYSLTFFDTERYRYFDLSSGAPIETSVSNAVRSNKLPITNNSIVMDTEFVTMVLYWDNNTYLGVYAPGADINNDWVINNDAWPSDGVLTIPSGATDFAIVSLKTSFGEFSNEGFTFTQISSTTADYEILYPTVPRIYLGQTLVYGSPPIVNYLSFDGSNDYASIPNNAFNPTTSWEIEFFFRPQALNPASTWFDNRDNSGGDGWRLFDNDNLRFGWGSANVLTDDGFLNINEYYEIKITYDGNTLSMFNFDTLIDSTTATNLFFQSTGPLNIGSERFKGRNRERWAALDLYYLRIKNDGQTTAEYDMSDGSGTTLTDISGNGNNGTIVGATWGQE